MMKSKTTIRTVVCFLTAGLLVGGLGGATVLGPLPPIFYGPTYRLDNKATDLVKDLNKLGLLKHISQNSLEDLLEYQRSSGKSLAQILRDARWAKNLNFTATPFKATWYA